jgi:hypothetical protein
LSTTPSSTSDLASVTARQLAAIEAFHRARHAAELAAASARQTRESRMDASRRIEVLRRQHEAIIDRADEAIRHSSDLLSTPRRLTAIVAHRQEWFTRKVGLALDRRGVTVLGHTYIGAEAVGWAVAEQPDLLVVEDTLAMLSGEQVVREVREYCDRTLITAQVAQADRIAPMLAAGANAVHVRLVPPDIIVDELLRLLPA